MRFSVSILFFCLAVSAGAQDKAALSDEIKSSTVSKLGELIVANYVFPDVGKATADYLDKKLKEGSFRNVKTEEDFADALTEAVQSVNHDKHMRIRTGQIRQGGARDIGVGGFKEAKMLDGNIGYIDMRLFLDPSQAAAVADAHMKTVSGARAIIIDLRSNGGGSPEMVQYLCSYFFDKPLHLNSLYFRTTQSTREFWTKDVNGKKLPDVPLFVLTSKRTFSGAEEFCYNMQTRKRATLVGETTGGGANPGDIFPINKSFSVFIPTGRAINPVTGTNWEGVGVSPDVKTSAEDALTKALDLAQGIAGRASR